MNKLIQSGEFWIDPFLQNELSHLSPIAFNELEKSILEIGLKDSIIYFIFDNKKIIIDGHHRLQICLKHKIPIISKELKFIGNTYEELILNIREWMVSFQIGRRNVPLFVKIEYALNYIKEMINLAPKNIKKATDKLAYVLKCSASYIKMSKKILKQIGSNVTPDLSGGNITPDLNKILKSLREGSISINEAYKQLKPKKIKTETTNQQQESKIENQDPIKYKSPLDAKNTIVDFNSLGIKKFKFDTEKNFIIPTESNPIYLDKYDLKKTIKLYSNQNNSFILEHNKTKTIITLDLLKHFQSLFTSSEILINDKKVNISIDSVKYEEMILSKGLIEVLIEDISSVISNKQE